VEKYCTAGQTADVNTAHAHCVLDNYIHTHVMQYLLKLEKNSDY
jgi:hypothetical protein